MGDGRLLLRLPVWACVVMNLALWGNLFCLVQSTNGKRLWQTNGCLSVFANFYAKSWSSFNIKKGN